MSLDARPAMTKVLERSGATGSDRLVLLTIAKFAKPDGTGSYASLAAIAREARVTEKATVKTIQRAIARLKAAGELIVETKAGPNGCNRYIVVCADDRQVDTQGVHSNGPLGHSGVSKSDSPPSLPGHLRPSTWTPGVEDLDTSGNSSGPPGVSYEQEGEQEREQEDQDSPSTALSVQLGVAEEVVEKELSRFPGLELAQVAETARSFQEGGDGLYALRAACHYERRTMEDPDARSDAWDEAKAAARREAA